MPIEITTPPARLVHGRRDLPGLAEARWRTGRRRRAAVHAGERQGRAGCGIHRQRHPQHRARCAKAWRARQGRARARLPARGRGDAAGSRCACGRRRPRACRCTPTQPLPHRSRANIFRQENRCPPPLFPRAPGHAVPQSNWHVDLATLEPTGKGGRIRERDVLAAATGKPMPLAVPEAPMQRSRRQPHAPHHRRADDVQRAEHRSGHPHLPLRCDPVGGVAPAAQIRGRLRPRPGRPVLHRHHRQTHGKRPADSPHARGPLGWRPRSAAHAHPHRHRRGHGRGPARAGDPRCAAGFA